jgi:hypothetical protein
LRHRDDELGAQRRLLHVLEGLEAILLLLARVPLIIPPELLAETLER